MYCKSYKSPLSRYLGLSRSAATKLLNRFEALGLVRRETMRRLDLTPLAKYLEDLEEGA